ncbi:MAG: PD-(D/E)XK nuclease domain-containing protein, partial [Spirochaetaceae bacterium]|nr:PD-(D/E)XK nuclease domain-containing protein [Spirochaetaceae bacterium]
SGYLTITGYDRETRSYTLGFPNGEVKYGFLNSLYDYFFPSSRSANGLSVLGFIKAVRAGEIETFLTQLKAFFAAIPYDLYFAKDEAYYRTIFYIVFTLLGQFAEAEVRSAAGRADAVVKTGDAIYVFEFKVDTAGTAEDALKQIDEKGYLVPYAADGRRLVKIGAVFDTGKRTLGEWLVCENGG